MPTLCHDNIAPCLKGQSHVNTRLMRVIVLALFLALTALAFTATPMFAQTPNILVDDFITVRQNSSVEIEVLANDNITEFASFDFTNPGNGKINSFTSNASRLLLTFDYSPNMNFVGQDSFVYRVIDRSGGSSYATVHITIYRVIDCSTCLVRHAATPVNVTLGGDGAFNYHFIGDGGVATGPLTPPVRKLIEMHAPGSGNIVLYDGANPISGAPVIISYLSSEQVIHVHTAYRDRHDGSMKPYIFVINQDNEVSHWEW